VGSFQLAKGKGQLAKGSWQFARGSLQLAKKQFANVHFKDKVLRNSKNL
jgi:hypothetical protein